MYCAGTENVDHYLALFACARRKPKWLIELLFHLLQSLYSVQRSNAQNEQKCLPFMLCCRNIRIGCCKWKHHHHHQTVQCHHQGVPVQYFHNPGSYVQTTVRAGSKVLQILPSKGEITPTRKHKVCLSKLRNVPRA